MVEFELLEGALITAIKKSELVARIRQDHDAGRGVGLLALLGNSSEACKELQVGLNAAGLQFTKFREYLTHKIAGKHDARDMVVHSILKSMLQSNQLITA